MASSAFDGFKYNLVDTERIIETFKKIKQSGAGLGHLTRGGIVLLCASWELYIEMVLRETAAFYIEKINHLKELPKSVQREISKSIKNHKNELSPLELAGDGWREYYKFYVEQRTNSLNTPKSNKLSILFSGLIGVPDIAAAWSLGTKELDDFISIRGDIAHRGRHADYMKIADLENYYEKITTYARETDVFLSEFIKKEVSCRPWNSAK